MAPMLLPMAAAIPLHGRQGQDPESIEIPAALLVRLFQWMGAPPDALERALGDDAPSGPSSQGRADDARSAAQRALDLRLEGLERACRRAGLRASGVELGLAAVSASVDRTRVLVGWHEQSGWIAVRDADGERLRVSVGGATDEWISVAELGRALPALADGASARWLLVDAGLSAAAGARGPEAAPLTPLRRLIELLRPDREDLLTVVLYAVFVGLLTLATPIAVQQLVNTVAFGGMVQPVVVLATLLFAGLAFAALLSIFQAYLAEVIQRRVFVRACIDLADRLPRVPLGAFGGRHGPELVNRFFDLVTIQKTGATLLLDGSAVVLQTVAGLLVLSFYHPLMLAFSFVLIASIAIVVFAFARQATRTAVRESQAKYDLGGWMEELARHPAAFRDVSARRFALARADALTSSWVESRRSHYRIVLRQIASSLGLQVVVSTLVLALGGWLVVSGQLTLGQLVASEIIVAVVVAAVARFGKQLESFYDLLAAVDKIGTLLDLPLERSGGRAPSASDRPAGVEARALAFAHTPGVPVFRDLELSVAAGERLAIDGPAASGKSSLIDVLCGLRPASGGHVLLDGEDLRELSLDGVRERVVCVREPEIFAGSIEDNVRVGRNHLSGPEVQEALRSVHLLGEIQALPQGARTRLSTDGAPLSRSQVARLMLARAIVGRPRMLALDGALEHLDAAMRAAIVRELFSKEAPWTLLVVSAHEDVLAACDRSVSLGAQASRDEKGGPS